MTTVPARDLFAGKPEARTSYDNQRGLAARNLGGSTLCLHAERLDAGCFVCRSSGSVLLPG